MFSSPKCTTVENTQRWKLLDFSPPLKLYYLHITEKMFATVFDISRCSSRSHKGGKGTLGRELTVGCMSRCLTVVVLLTMLFRCAVWKERQKEGWAHLLPQKVDTEKALLQSCRPRWSGIVSLPCVLVFSLSTLVIHFPFIHAYSHTCKVYLQGQNTSQNSNNYILWLILYLPHMLWQTC